MEVYEIGKSYPLFADVNPIEGNLYTKDSGGVHRYYKNGRQHKLCLGWYNFVRAESERKATKRKCREYDKAHKQLHKNRRLLNLYGLTEKAYRQMIDDQKGTCLMPLCQTVIRAYNRNTHIDHCHVTGKVRGVLCQQCNISLGHYEKIDKLGAAEYLTLTNVI